MYTLILQLPVYAQEDDAQTFVAVYDKRLTLPFIPDRGHVIECHVQNIDGDGFSYIDYTLQQPVWSEHRQAFVERRAPMLFDSVMLAEVFGQMLADFQGWVVSDVDFTRFVELDVEDGVMGAILQAYGIED